MKGWAPELQCWMLGVAEERKGDRGGAPRHTHSAAWEVWGYSRCRGRRAHLQANQARPAACLCSQLSILLLWSCCPAPLHSAPAASGPETLPRIGGQDPAVSAPKGLRLGLTQGSWLRRAEVLGGVSGPGKVSGLHRVPGAGQQVPAEQGGGRRAQRAGREGKAATPLSSPKLLGWRGGGGKPTLFT